MSESNYKGPLDCKKLCKCFHEPPFPYFASVYMTLLSVIQGIFFSCVIISCSENIDFNLFYFDEFFYQKINVLIVITLIWHNYINHHQLIGWQLNILDSFIIILFGLIQGIMIFSLNQHILSHIYFSIVGVLILGTFAYWYAEKQIQKEYVQTILIEHYKKCSGNQAINVYYFLVGFENTLKKQILYLTISIVIISCISYFKPFLKETLDFWLSLISIFILIYFFSRTDLQYWIKDTNWQRMIDLGKKIRDE